MLIIEYYISSILDSNISLRESVGVSVLLLYILVNKVTVCLCNGFTYKCRVVISHDVTRYFVC